MDATVTIERGGAERIPQLQPLWEALHHHHAAIAPHLRALGPMRSPQESWLVRRGLYEEWLAEPDAFVLVAEAGGEPVGYALVHMRAPDETWATGDRIAELESLAVLPEYRRLGVGRALVDAVFEHLRALDVSHWGVGVMSSNADAIRFYERLGLLPFISTYVGKVPAA
jgi:ribosomal protein S18 acetylase RimI-like enzyme